MSELIKTNTGRVVNFVAVKLVSKTKSDSDRFKQGYLYVGTGGDVAVLAAGDTSPVTLTNVPDGTILPIFVIAIYSTNTTASDFVMLY